MSLISFIDTAAEILIDTSIKATVLLMLALIATRLLRRASAATTYSIWAFTMLSLILLPLATWMLPSWSIPILPA
ncbi:MAG: hypothetical protein CMJ78_08090 [Planctomycetaceae bacterium]|nr:hypothetical protein [Planctomycetaceae bacterium]